VRISRSLYDEMIAHAREDAPNECCGMIAAQDGRAVQLYRAVYEVDPQDQYRIEMAIEDAGMELGAIYHSHTRSEPYPSQTDINLAFHPDALYVIVGLNGSEPDVRAWRIVDGEVSAGDLQVVDD
jgi:proteasome lid subunit RPN8/RPN11